MDLYVFIIFLIFITGIYCDIWTDSGPVFIYQPKSKITFLHSDGVRIDCSGHGIPSITTEWIDRNGDRVNNNHKNLLKQLNNGSLLIMPFQRHEFKSHIHSNTYFCMLKNQHGTIISRPVQVRAKISNGIITPRVYDEYFIEGNIASLKCSLPSYSMDDFIVLKWLKDDEPIQANNKYIIDKHGVLYIKNVNQRDEIFEYNCEIKDKFTGEIQTSVQGGRLHISASKNGIAPKINEITKNVMVNEGEDVLLSCISQAYPVPNYRWSIPNKKRQKFIGSQNTAFLNMKNLKIDDEGRYECSAFNSIGSDKISINLKVRVELTAFIEREKISLNDGGELKINCRVTGSPIDEIYWYKDGSPLQKFGENLLIEDTTSKDIGSYQCFAKNSFETVQASTCVFPGNMIPEVINGFESLVLSPGSNTEIECLAMGKPMPIFKWLRDGIEIQQNRKTRFGSNIVDGMVKSVVSIQEITPEESGSFTCIASNEVGNGSHTAKLQVYGDPHVRPLKNISAVEGHNLTLKCYVYGYPVNSIMWTKENNGLENQNFDATNDGSLKLIKIENDKDSGKYTCSALKSNKVKHSQSLWLRIAMKPKIDEFFFSKSLDLNENLMLYCVILKGSQPVKIEWLFDHKKINLHSGIMISETNKYSTLQIDKVKQQHSGNYTCVASNIAGTDEWTIDVEVKAPPRFITKPNRVKLLLGEDAKFDCKVKGSPKPSTIWMRFKESIIESEKYRILKNNSLIIKRIDQNDIGPYSCKASNGIGSPIIAQTNLVLSESLIVRKEKIKIIGKDGSNVLLTCHISGPQSTIEWFDGSTSIVENEIYRISNTKIEGQVMTTLQFTKSILKAPRNFKCVAKNRQHKKEESFFLNPMKLSKSINAAFNKSDAILWNDKNSRNEKNQELNEAPIHFTIPFSIIQKPTAQSSLDNANKENNKVTFLQILIASVTTAIIILLFVLLLVIIVLWKRRSDRNEIKSNYHLEEMKQLDYENQSNSNTIDKRYGQLRPRSARSCETLTGSGYYSTISPYATFDPMDDEISTGHRTILSRKISNAPVNEF